MFSKHRQTILKSMLKKICLCKYMGCKTILKIQVWLFMLAEIQDCFSVLPLHELKIYCQYKYKILFLYTINYHVVIITFTKCMNFNSCVITDVLCNFFTRYASWRNLPFLTIFRKLSAFVSTVYKRLFSGCTREFLHNFGYSIP